MDQGTNVEWHDDPYHLVDIPEPGEPLEPQEPPEPEELQQPQDPQEPQETQEISDMFAEIDHALDELDDVVAAEEGK